MTLKIYFNPQCSKCKIAKNHLEKNNCKFQIINYLEKPITKKDIKEILQKGSLTINDILRKNEPEYQEHIKSKNLSENQIIEMIIKHPRILQRPIIISKDKAIIARDEKSLKQF
ncbi:MAG: ArsC/Spx/MgsR family protein [Candidatus Pacearchaeota archaeon]|nr:ArsC/Spx/MgsR family protein [Candidatus Pacearchaeota archaeon]